MRPRARSRSCCASRRRKGVARELRQVAPITTRWGSAASPTLLRDAGMAVRRAPDSGTVAADGDLPISDADADALADAAKADLVAIAGVTVGEPVAVRGQPQPAVLVTAHVRLIDRAAHALVGQGTAIAAARGRRSALRDRSRARRRRAPTSCRPRRRSSRQAGAFTGDDTPFAEPGVVLVRLSSKTPFAMVLAEQKYPRRCEGRARREPAPAVAGRLGDRRDHRASRSSASRRSRRSRRRPIPRRA